MHFVPHRTDGIRSRRMRRYHKVTSYYLTFRFLFPKRMPCCGVMAWPLRVYIADGWYHVISRGIERRALFTDDRDRRHFLGLLERSTDRHRFETHAYVLMDSRDRAVGFEELVAAVEQMSGQAFGNILKERGAGHGRCCGGAHRICRGP